MFDEPTLAEPDFMVGNQFWDKYKLPIMALVVLVVAAIVTAEIYQNIHQAAVAKASQRLDDAKDAADYQHIIDNFSGTPAAANAYLLLGRFKLNAKDYAGAAQVWQSFADKYPQDLLAPAALDGTGGALEAQGKYDEARTAYQKAATSYPKSYIAPLARLDEAALLKSQRKLEDARRVYENILASYPQSEVIPQAQAELATLKALPPTAGTMPVASPAGSPAAVTSSPAPESGSPIPTGPSTVVPPVAVPVPAAQPPVSTLPGAASPAMAPGSPAPAQVSVPVSPAAVETAAAFGAPEPVLPLATPVATVAPTVAPANAATPAPSVSDPAPEH